MRIFKTKESLSLLCGALTIFASIVLPLTAQASSYYVDGANIGGTCSDSNNGTTLSTPWCTVSKAAATAAAGDTVNIRGGTYHETMTPVNSGTSGSPIIFQKYSNETPIIDAADLLTGWSPASYDEAWIQNDLFADGFESADNTFNNWNAGHSIDSGVTMVSSTAVPNHGLYSLAATFSGSGVNARIGESFTAQSNVYARMYFYVNSSYQILPLNNGQIVMDLKENGGSLEVGYIKLVNSSAGNFYLAGYVTNPATGSLVQFASTTAGSVVPNTWYQVVMYYNGGSVSAGGAQMWLNGTSAGSNFTFNTSTTTVNRINVGSESGGATPSSGSTLYIDDVLVSPNSISSFVGGNANQYHTTFTGYTATNIYQNGNRIASTTIPTLSANTWAYSPNNKLLWFQTSSGGVPTNVEAAHRNNAVYMENKQYITIDGLTARYNGSLYEAAISASSSAYITIKNSTINDNLGSGVMLTKTSTSTVTGNTIVRSDTLGFAANPGYAGVRLQMGSSYDMVSNNNFSDLGNQGLGGNGIQTCGTHDYCYGLANNYDTFQNNTFFNMNDSCIYVSGLDQYGLIQNNLCDLAHKWLNGATYAGGHAFHIARGAQNWVIRNNIVIDTDQNAIAPDSSSPDQGVAAPVNYISIYNNTVYLSAAGIGNAAFANGTSTGITLFNNVFYQTNNTTMAWTSPLITPGFAADYNLYYKPVGSTFLGNVTIGSNTTAYSTLASYQTASGFEAHSLVGNPLFSNPASNQSSATPANDFFISPNSLAFESGVVNAVTSSRTSDFFGNPIYSGAPDMGAIEYQPPYHMGSDYVSNGGQIRVFGDGSYLYLAATSSPATARFAVSPVGGWPGSVTSPIPQYFDITVSDWQTAGTYRKAWTASSSVQAPAVFTVGNLRPSTVYKLNVDGSSYAQATSNSAGVATFTYSGGWSTHTFEVVSPGYVSSVDAFLHILGKVIFKGKVILK